MKFFILKPGETLPIHLLEALNAANQRLSNSKNTTAYINEIRDIFDLNVIENIGLNQKYFLGGFIEGEGSINLSIKRHPNSPFGILLDPEFSVAQHVNGVALLYLALNIFGCGRIKFKHGSNATLVYIIDNRELLMSNVIPFYRNYVNIYGSKIKTDRVNQFEQILQHIQAGNHKNINILVSEILNSSYMGFS